MLLAVYFFRTGSSTLDGIMKVGWVEEMNYISQHLTVFMESQISF